MWKPIVWKRAARVFSLVLIVMFVVVNLIAAAGALSRSSLA